MILKKVFLSLFIFSLVMSQTTPELGIRQKPVGSILITDVDVMLSPGNLQQNVSIYVKDGVIMAVGKNVKVPKATPIKSMKGKRIYPGFIDVFSDYGIEKAKAAPRSGPRPPKYEGDREGTNAWNDAIHSEENWYRHFKANGKAGMDLMKQGFTVVQSSRMDGIFRGRSFVTLLGDGLENDLILKSEGSHFASFNKGVSQQSYPNSLMGTMNLIRQTILDKDWYRNAQSAYAVNPNQPMPEKNAALEALQSVNREGIYFEAGNYLNVIRAGELAKEMKIPFYILGSGEEYQRIADIKALNTTLVMPVSLPKKPDLNSVDDRLSVELETLRHWERAPYNLKTLVDAKINFVLTAYGLEKTADFLNNLREYIKAGLSENQALAALTTGPAKLLGLSQIGTIASGKLANFIITDGNIFDEKSKIYAVWTAGHATDLIDMDAVDYRANYSLNLNNQLLTLEIGGEISKPELSMKIGTKSIKAKSAEIENMKLNFTIEPDTAGFEGLMSFSAIMTDAGLSGYVVSENGEREFWQASKSSDFSPKMDDKKSDDKSMAMISKLTYPNIAYGLESMAKRQSVLIKNATIWTSEANFELAGYDMLVENGKIEEIGKNLSASSNTLVIDGTGKFVTAGIVDEHLHNALSDVNEGSHAVTAEVDMGDVVNPDDIAIYRHLANGTTAAQLLHGSANPIGGRAQVIKMRWGANADGLKYDKAPPTIKFALGENVKQSNWGDLNNIRYPQTRMGVQTIMRDVFQAAREYEAEWKAYNDLSSSDKKETVPPRKNIQLDVILEILNGKRFVHSHSYVQSEILMLMRLAEEFNFRIATFTHILEGYKVAPEMAKHGVMGSTFADWWAYKFEVYDANAYNAALMAEKGVVVSINSDDWGGYARLNQEAAKSTIHGGMSQENAWKMVTINPAIQLKIDKWIGSLKAGKEADFVIWNGNPLSIYSKVEQTWVDGVRYFDLESDAKMRKAVEDEKAALIKKITGDGKKEKSTKKGGQK
ncbi:MAG: amidohydrolase family protein [Calditrichaeota bacterium]|nr:amidohydrolase family protein [Calditrichota bacterium]